MSKAKTEGGGHGMTTDPLDGLEQLRRIIDEQPEPAPESVMLGLDYCYAEWVAERARHAEDVLAVMRVTHAERARHAEELRRMTEERDDLKRHYEEALECETESLRDQLRLIRSLRAIARSPYTSADDLAADILAALGASAARGARK